MASKHHPYESGYVIDYEDGDFSLESEFNTIRDESSDILHTVLEGETLQSISYKYYGDSGLWYHIANVNSIFNPFDINEVYPGKILNIPNYGR